MSDGKPGGVIGTMVDHDGSVFVGVLAADGSFMDLIALAEAPGGKMKISCQLAEINDLTVITVEQASEIASMLCRRAGLMKMCAEHIQKALKRMSERNGG